MFQPRSLGFVVIFGVTSFPVTMFEVNSASLRCFRHSAVSRPARLFPGISRVLSTCGFFRPLCSQASELSHPSKVKNCVQNTPVHLHRALRDSPMQQASHCYQTVREDQPPARQPAKAEHLETSAVCAASRKKKSSLMAAINAITSLQSEPIDCHVGLTFTKPLLTKNNVLNGIRLFSPSTFLLLELNVAGRRRKHIIVTFFLFMLLPIHITTP